jgi:hypothetical protein
MQSVSLADKAKSLTGKAKHYGVPHPVLYKPPALGLL